MPRLIAIIQGPGPDLAALPRAVTSSVGFLAGRLGGLVRARFEGALREHSLLPRDYLLMLVLSEEAPLSQQALGARGHGPHHHHAGGPKSRRSGSRAG